MTQESLTITENAVTRVARQRQSVGNNGLFLRLLVEGGGCSGFQYVLSWDDQKTPEDLVFAESVLIDSVSLPYLAGSVVDYEVTMMGEDFKIKNPNATSGCGCGSSFGV